MFILSLIFSLFTSADYVQNKVDILTATGLEEKTIVAETQKSLEEILLCSESGFSSGLEEFFVDSYTTPTNSLNMTNFTVVTDVTGPSSVSCYATDTYMCYTSWIQKNGTWQVLGSECDYDEVAQD